MISVTCIAPVNIAVIKYWGKRDNKLILPINDSISGTISTDEIHAKTTIAISPDFTKNRFWLNGEELSIESNNRMKSCIELLRSIAEKKYPNNDILKYNLHICSKNNFPTACGLASSAAGFACLVFTLANLYGIHDIDLTPIARQGSGSACRSLSGGFVHWIKGTQENGEDSKAVQLVDEYHWPEISILILIINDKKKIINSTSGMATSVQTSELLKYRAGQCVNEHIRIMKEAIQNKDFETFANLTMKDSNQLHAVCLDTYPPCVYMTDTSHQIAQFVHKYNETIGEIRVAYTFDAGPNAWLYIQKSEVNHFVSALNVMFPNDNLVNDSYIRGVPVEYVPLDNKLLQVTKQPNEKNLLKYIFHTKLGSGPTKLAESASLLNSDGLPNEII